MVPSLKHVTVGIAGHVDHGKTSLVKGLTGIDTDRLKEEKRRRLSIESGIAPLPSHDDLSISLVDVPGHTDFLKNTIRGLSCVDFAVLVVAADDGVMPQTTEHVHILSLNGVKDGFIVLSKSDLVDEETLALAELEIKETLAGTFLDGKPVKPFSAPDGRGLEEIKGLINKMAGNASLKDASGPFRLWIDRMKAFPGFGTVVSGTVLSGMVRQDDPLVIMPKGIDTRVRALECHHEKILAASAGQRIGVNLHKVRINNIKRGMVLAAPGKLTPFFIYNVHLYILDSAERPVRHRQKVKIYIGTAIINATLILMESTQLEPGEGGFAQLRLMKPLAALPGDPFIVSLMNMPIIIGGGKILENTREKYRKITATETLGCLKALMDRDIGQYMDYRFRKKGCLLIKAEETALNTGFRLPDIKREMDKRIKKGELIGFKRVTVMSRQTYERLKASLPRVLEEILNKDPLKHNIKQEEIKTRLAPALDDEPLEKMLYELSNKGILIRESGGFRPTGFSASLSEEQNMIISIILDHSSQSGLVPFSADTIWKKHRKKYDKGKIKKLMTFLRVQNKLVRVNDGRFLSVEALEQIKIKIAEVIRQKGLFTIPDCTPVLGYGRTVAIPILEYLDASGFTIRVEQGRRLKDNDKYPKKLMR